MIIGPAVLWCTCALLALSTLAGIIVALRTARAQANEQARPVFAWWLGAGAFAIVAGSSLWIVNDFSYSHAWWDQWLETDLYHRFLSHRYGWRQLFEPHNEHRIVLSRVWALALFVVDRQWDNRVQTAANTFLHALPVGALVTLLTHRLRPIEAVAAALALVLPWAIPLARENIVWGFQSQFYFLLLYVPLALWLLTHEKPSSIGFWLGLWFTMLALVSLGSGALCPLALLGVSVIEALRWRAGVRARLPLMIALLALAIVGIQSRSHYAGNLSQHAHSLVDFLGTALRTAAFPFVHHPALAPVMWSPALLWFARLVRQRRVWTNDERFLSALGAFVLLHAPAVGYARGAGGQDPASRYFDILSLGLLVNTLAITSLLREIRVRWRWAPVLAWALVAGIGGGVRAAESHRDMLMIREMQKEQERRLQQYVRTGDPSHLQAPYAWQVPFMKIDWLTHWLDDGLIRSFLPWSIRAPLPVKVVGTPLGFASPGLPGYAGAPVRNAFADWGTAQTAHRELRIEVAASSQPKLRFGFIGNPGTHLAMVADGHRSIIPAPPVHSVSWVDGVTWSAPHGAFTLEAESAPGDAWWGFTAPVEVGRLAGAMDHIGKLGRVLLGLGVLLWLMAAGVMLRRRRREP